MKFFSQFEFPAPTSIRTQKNPRLILTRSHQIAPPDQQKSAIWGNQAEIGCGFLHMERDQLQFLGFLPTVLVIIYNLMENLKYI